MRAVVIVLAAGSLVACPRSQPAAPDTPSLDTERARALREELVSEVERREDVSARTAGALRRVPRHLFAPALSLEAAYADSPEPIGFGQTISQPRIVAVMTDALELEGTERVLEIGTGSGYQAAVLSLLAREVFTIEIVPELGEAARRRLAELGYANVHVRVGDGYAGWPEKAPFDRVLVTAAPDAIPAELVRELAEGGAMVLPVGAQGADQRLVRLRKRGGAVRQQDLGGVRFVPMVPSDR